MKRLVEFPLRTGGAVTVEVDEVSDGLQPAAAGSAKAKELFEDALAKTKLIAGALLDELRNLAVAPTEVEVEFGLKMSSTAGVVLASGTAETNVRVNLKWTRGGTQA